MMSVLTPPVDHWPAALKSAASLQGTLIAVGPGFRPAAWPDTSATRCAALGSLLTPKFAAANLTAAWVWRACPDPQSPLSFITRQGRVPPLMQIPGVELREFTLADGELTYIGEFAVTSPLRTAFDIVRAESSFTKFRVTVCRRLLDISGLGWEALQQRAALSNNVDRARVQHRVQAVLRSESV